MMDRLTEWTGLGAIALKYQENFDMSEEDFAEYQKVLNKLAHYEDLEEAGRLMIFPKDYDSEKFKEENCPSTLGLKEYCYEDADCDECWEAALKEREAE